MLIFNFAIKILFCFVLAMLSTFITFLIFTTTSSKYNGYIWLSHFIIFQFDVFINCTCLMLQWPFAKNIYTKLCGKCDDGIKQCYLKNNKNSDLNNAFSISLEMIPSN